LVPANPDPAPAPSRTEAGPASFSRIVCAIDDGAAARETVQCAVALAGAGITLDFLSVSDGRGVAGARSASLGPASARRALDEARWVARRSGVRARADLRHHHDAPAAILAAAGEDDLLVTAASGPLMGLVAPVPVLFARAVPAGRDFPRDVLIATDATPASREVVAVAGALSRRHDVRPVLVHVGPARRASRQELAEQATLLIEATGAEPVTLRVDGVADQELVRLAGALPAALLVVGGQSATVVASAPIPVLAVPVATRI
jgi:nucleotide-binding universal stress UspA family protein